MVLVVAPRTIIVGLLVVASATAGAAAPRELTARSYNTHGVTSGVVLLEIDWNRRWGCAGFENAQLQALKFSRLPLASTLTDQVELDLRPANRLFVKGTFRSYALLIPPGEYALTEFDVKIARSATDVGHVRGTISELFEAGKPIGGTFTVAAGEVVYIGHLSLDCAQEPIPWRYYVDGREEFAQYVARFRKKFPFVRQTPVEFRLLSTTMFGEPYSLD